MDYPADCYMLMLVAHAAGDRFAVVGGELVVTVQSEDRVVPVPVDALDVLEPLGWIEVRPDGETVLTERGRYWCQRWLVARLGKGRLKKTTGLRFTATKGGGGHVRREIDRGDYGAEVET